MVRVLVQAPSIGPTADTEEHDGAASSQRAFGDDKRQRAAPTNDAERRRLRGGSRFSGGRRQFYCPGAPAGRLNTRLPRVRMKETMAATAGS